MRLKKILALVLALALTVGVVPAMSISALAEEATEELTDEDIEALSFGVTMYAGAQVRVGGEAVVQNGKIASEESGLRFIATVDLKDTKAGYVITYHYDSETRTYDEGYEIGVTITAESSDYSVDIPATNWQAADHSSFTVALTGLAESNYNRKFTATPYVKIDGTKYVDSNVENKVTRSIYQVSAGLLTTEKSEGDNTQNLEDDDQIIDVLNAYVNQTGIRLTLTDGSETGELVVRDKDSGKSGAYSGNAFFEVGTTTYENGVYTVTLTPKGSSVINTLIAKEYIRINNNNSKIAEYTSIEDNGDGTYTLKFNYGKMVPKKFDVKFPNVDDYLYRVGNANTVALGSLFTEAEGSIGIDDENVKLEFTPVAGNATVATQKENNEDWTQETVKFSGTGVVKVTITDNYYCTPTELYLEVVDAKNVTSYSELSSTNSVLLNDITMSSGSSYYLSGATLYGNGFTFDMTDGTYAAGGNTSSNYVFGLNNATIDNTNVVGAVYTKYGATVQSEYNRAAVLSDGNSTIVNSCISNCASAVRIKDGNLEIINSTIKGGNFANIDIRGGHVVLDNVTTINQVNGNDKAEDGTIVVGLGIVVYYENVLNTTTVEIKNGITQYNNLSETQANTYITDTTAKQLTSQMYNATYSDLQYDDGTDTWVNTGIISMIDTVGNDNITDVEGYVDGSPTLVGKTGYIHTKVPDATSIAATAPEYTTAGQGPIAPSCSFDYTTKNYVAKTDGSNDCCYEESGTVYISMDEGDTFNWDTSILTATKAGQTLDYTVSMSGTDYTGKSIAFNTAGNYEVEYTYTDSYNYNMEDGNVVAYDISYTKTVEISVAVIEAAAKNAEFTMGSSNAATEKITVDNVTYISATGVTADNSTWTYMTIGSEKIYYPIIAAKLTSTKGSSSYAYFPVFENAVTITDYADGGTGDAITYNASTTTLPSGLTPVKGVYKAAADVTSWTNLNNSHLKESGASKIFKWATSSDAPSAPTTYNNVLCYKSTQVSADRDAYITLVQYSYTDATNTTYYYYVGYTLEAFKKSSICVTPDTLVTMADGTQKEIQYVSVGEEVLVWNHMTGDFDTAPVGIISNHKGVVADFEVVTLIFEDGKSIEVIGEHECFDKDLMQYVSLDANASDYIGHRFAVMTDGALTESKLVAVEKEIRETEIWGLISDKNLNCFTNGVLSSGAETKEILNAFEFDGNALQYNPEKMKQDIATYGLYTYEDFEDLMPKEWFDILNCQYLKVAVGKGQITWEYILDWVGLANSAYEEIQ